MGRRLGRGARAGGRRGLLSLPAGGVARGRGRWTRRLAALLASLLLAFVLVELGFRAVESVRLASGELWAVYDPVVGFRNNPRYGDHSPEGFRDRPLEPKGARARLLLLGDSVAYYGEDADDTFPGRLEARLATTSDLAPVDVVNAAVKGWTDWQEVTWLREQGLALEPDLVGVAFVLNDCHRFLHAFRIEDGRIVGQSYDFHPEAVASVDSWLYRTLRKSRFLVWARHRLSVLDAGSLSVSGEGFSFDYRPDFRNAWLDAPWARIEEQLGELVRLGREHAFRPFVVVFPFGEQYREDYLARDPDYVLKPQRELAAVCGRLALPLLDLYASLDPALDLEADGIHLTPRGRGRVAELLEAFLRATDLLPKRSS